MTKAITQTYSLVHENRRKIITALLLGCLGMAFVYVLNVYTVISRTVAVQNVEEQIIKLGGEVENMDSEYIALSSSLTPENLGKYGMTEGKVTEYIYRSVALGMNK